HANQRALAHTTASENAHALPPPASEESINRPNAAAERLADRNALQRQRSRGIERAILAPVVRSQRIESLAAAVNHPPQQAIADANHRPLPPGRNPVAKTYS